MELSTTESYTPALPSAFRDCADILQCPITGEPLFAVEGGWSSAGGQRHYPVDHGIPQHRLNRSVVRSDSLRGWPMRSSGILSLNPAVSTTKVSASQ